MVDKIQDRPCEALKSLMGYQQADMDGIMVLASRQAIHEVSDYIIKLEDALEKVAGAHFDLSLHKQHDTLTYLKKVAANALAKLTDEVG